MKFVEIALMLICLNIAFTVVNQLKLVPIAPGFDESYKNAGSVNEFGEYYLINDSDNLGYVQKRLLDEQIYTKSGITGSQFQDVDFLTGIWMMVELVGQGLTMVKPTLNSIGIPPKLQYLFYGPIYFMYMIAVLQVISGRNVEANK